jgi:DNA recombination protein RmuC
MVLAIVVSAAIALVIGAAGAWSWLSATKERELQRAIAERDMAIAERTRSAAEASTTRDRFEAEQRARTAAETRLAESERLLAERAQMRQDLENAFAALAQKTLTTVGESLVSMNKAHLDGSKGDIALTLDTKKAEIETLLKPLRDMLDNYRGELVKSEHVRNEVYGGLQEQIRNLLSIQESAQRESSRLANALQSPAVRGSWGESSLRRCVELAGMSEFCDFSVQETFENEDGGRLRPDMIIRLPNQKVIAVDAKAPGDQYVAASNEADEARKREYLEQHARNVRRHIEALSRKEYQSSIGDTLDFSVMFLPGEHLLSAALVTDPTIFEYAVEKKIYLASPTVLLPLLRAVAAGWKAEKTEENARRIHEAGLQLFERFVNVMDYIAAVGKALAQAVGKYNIAVRSIDARLRPKGEELQRLTGSGRELASLEQVDASAMEPPKLRLTMQDEEQESTTAPHSEPLLLPLDRS